MVVEKGCYGGKVLTVDLSTKEGKRQKIGDSFALKYLGGDGFGAYFLNKIVSPESDPLSDENALVIAPGLFVGTPVPTGGKTSFFAKSPLTNGWGEGVMGGRIGFALKQAGYDALIITGKAEKPSYLRLCDDEVKVKSAEHLWGKSTRETAEIIKKDEEGAIVATIGIGGEKLVRYAVIDCEERQAGRGGMGAVMGAKNLKAIAIEGSRDITVTDQEKMMSLLEMWYTKMLEHPSFEDDGKYGTGEFLEWINAEKGTFPTKNWSEGTFEERKEIDPYYWAPRYVLKNKGCVQCTKPCGKAFVIKGAYEGELDGVEYETLFSLGANCGNLSIEALAKANELCDLYGIDTISAGGVIGFAMDLYENEILGREDLGMDLHFGNSAAVVEMVEKIARREGVGNTLAEGVKRASERIGKGAEKYAVHVRGMEPPAYDVRGIKGMGLAFMTSPRGACHLRSGAYSLELTGKFWRYEGIDRFSAESKGKEIVDMENFMAVYDALGVCKFSRGIFLLEGFGDLLEAGIGKKMSEEDFVHVGERICNLKHIFNIRCGWKKEDTHLPEKIRKPIPQGVSKGAFISVKEEKKMLTDYFLARGWDKKGIPTEKKLKELEIEQSLQS